MKKVGKETKPYIKSNLYFICGIRKLKCFYLIISIYSWITETGTPPRISEKAFLHVLERSDKNSISLHKEERELWKQHLGDDIEACLMLESKNSYCVVQWWTYNSFSCASQPE